MAKSQKRSRAGAKKTSRTSKRSGGRGAKSTGRRSAKRRGTGKRDLVKTPSSARYTKRTAKGRFKESDDVGRSQRSDKRTAAKRRVKSGYGDRGDR